MAPGLSDLSPDGSAEDSKGHSPGTRAGSSSAATEEGLLISSSKGRREQLEAELVRS